MDFGETNPEDYFTLITQNTQKLGEIIQVINQTKTYFDDQIAHCADSNVSDLISMCKSYALNHCNETANVIGDIGIDLSCLLSYQASRVQNITLRLNSIQSKMISHEQKVAADYSREITFLRTYIPRRLKYQRITDPILPPGVDPKVTEFNHQPLDLNQLASSSADDDWMPITTGRDHSYSVAPTLQKFSVTPNRVKSNWRSQVAQVDPHAGATTKEGSDMSFFRQTPTGHNVQSYVPTQTTTATFSAPTVNFAIPEEAAPAAAPAANKLQVVKLSALKGKPGAPQTPSNAAPSSSSSSSSSTPGVPLSAAPPPPTPTSASTPTSHLSPPPPRGHLSPPPPQRQSSFDYDNESSLTRNTAPSFDVYSAPAPPPPSNSGGYSQFDETRSSSGSNFDAFSQQAPPPPAPSDHSRMTPLHEDNGYQNYAYEEESSPAPPPPPDQDYPYDYGQQDQQYDYSNYQQEQHYEEPAAATEEVVDGYYDEAGNWWYRDYDGEYKMWVPPAE
jgi:hypothetical protein